MENVIRLSSSRLQPPQHLVHLIPRPRLIEQLDAAVPRALTLLHAPAGYGKTALLSQWWEMLAARGMARMWLTLDQTNGGAAIIDVIRFALGEAGMEIAQFVNAPLRSVQEHDGHAALNRLLYDMSLFEQPVVLILDDYHLVQSPETDKLIDLLLRGLPERVHLVIATRIRPTVAIAVLRAQGRMEEIGLDGLRFTESEGRELLHPDVDEADAGALTTHCEGWPIAVQLAGFWVRGSEDAHALVTQFSGSVSDVADYLAHQVLSELPERLQQFLLETSILDRISAPAADAVRGRTDSAQMLAELARYNMLLLPADRERNVYRHHQLLAEYLAAQQIMLGEARIAALHAEAAGWFDRAGDSLRAVGHAIAAGRTDDAVAIVERFCSVRACLSENSTVRALLRQLPRDRIERSCRLLLGTAVASMQSGALSLGEEQLERARQLLADRPPPPAEARSIRRAILFIEALRRIYQDQPLLPEQEAELEALAGEDLDYDIWFRGLHHNLVSVARMRRGDLDGAKLSIHQALGRFHEADSPYASLYMNVHLATILLYQGKLQEAANALRAAEDIALRGFPGHDHLLALPQILLAEIAFEQNNATRATALLRENLAILESSEGWVEIHISTYGTAAALALADGDVAGAEASLDRGTELARKRGLPRLEFALALRRALLLIQQRRVEEADILLGVLETRNGVGLTWNERHDLALTRGQLLLAQSDPVTPLSIFAEVKASALSGGHMRTVMRALALEACACYVKGDTDRAVALLFETIALAQPERFVRLFVDAGLPMMGLLHEAMRDAEGAGRSAASIAYIGELLEGFGDLRRSTEKLRLIRLLTAREHQVLRELARGSSNKVIGRALDLGEDAIKFHLKNIYRKLGVASRVMAVTVAQKLDLLS